MKRLVAASLLLAALVAPRPARAEEAVRVEGVAMTTTRASTRLVQAEFAARMRGLWEDQSTFTRNFVISSLAGLGDTDAVTLRLLANQDEIAGALKPFYGAATGDRLAVLLRDQVMIAADVIKAARTRDAAALTARKLAWAANADRIAALLAEVNPAWSRPALVAMLRRHLELTTMAITARLRADWSADLEAYDLGHAQLLDVATVITDGVVKQHRRRFVR